VQKLHAGLPLQQFHGQMTRRRHSGRSIPDRPGIRAGEIDEIRDRSGRQGRMGEQDIGPRRHPRDVREILQRIVSELRIERGARCQRHADAHEQGVAVGTGASRDLGGQISARPGTIVDDHALTEALRQDGADEPVQKVRTAAGREGIDQPDGSARV